MNIERRLHAAGLDKCEVVNLQRRLFLRTGLTLGAATLLSGCDVITNTAPVDGFLRMISSFNDGVQAALFSPNRLAPTFPEHMVAPELPLQRAVRAGADPRDQSGHLAAGSLRAASPTRRRGRSTGSSRCRSAPT